MKEQDGRTEGKERTGGMAEMRDGRTE